MPQRHSEQQLRTAAFVGFSLAEHACGYGQSLQTANGAELLHVAVTSMYADMFRRWLKHRATEHHHLHWGLFADMAASGPLSETGPVGADGGALSHNLAEQRRNEGGHAARTTAAGL